MQTVIVATFRPHADRVDEVRSALTQVVTESRNEPGCDFYSLHEGQDSLVIIEQWADCESLRAHAVNAKPLFERLSVALTKPMEVQMLRPTDGIGLQGMKAMPN